ncbi:MAG: ABC transporter ATP-binding protein [Planctomycetes bacterium]|nr:ABC transporter ATP-binding protein [Planctomycetota bacterium]
MKVSKYAILYHFLKPYKRLYGALLVVTVLASVLESLSVLAFFPLFSSALGTSQEGTSGILGAMSSLAGLLPFSEPIVAASVFLIVVFVVKTAVSLIKDALIAYSGARVLYDVKNQIMQKYAKAQYQFFLDSKQGTLIYNSQIAPHRVGILLLRVPLILAELFKVIAITIVLMLVAPYAMLSMAVLGIVYYLVINFLSNKVSYSFGKRKAEAYTEQTVIAEEYFSGIRHIIAFRTLGVWLERFRRSNRIFSELHGRDLILNSTPRHIVQMMAVVLMSGLIIVLWYSSPSSFTSTLPKIGLFAVALAQLLPSITSIGRMRMEVMGGLADIELVYDTLTGPIPLRQDGNEILETFEKSIAFESVCFSYEGRDTLLKNADIVFEKGKVTAIVGPSGAGKTSIINLVLGFFDPTGGQITIDGKPMKDYTLESRLGKIGMVSQDPFLFHASIVDNIVFGRAGYSTDAIVEAAKVANAHEFISELAEGYDTIVGDMGMKLSGGQQQRIAIARAVLERPEILIFDEATSSLDTISEKQVQQAVEAVSKDRTVILIAHRLSTVRHADKIIVLDRGEIVEQGSHQELLDHQGHYSQLVASAG